MIRRLLARYRSWRWPKCACGEHRVAPGCRMELAGVSHGHTPCFHCGPVDEEPKVSHCTHWDHRGEVCCVCGRVFPHDEWPPGHGVPCTPENVDSP